jgi:uncharacterized protein (TIGR02246 family)
MNATGIAGRLAALLLSLLIVSCAAPTTAASSDEDAIRKTLVALNAACAARDLPAFIALFDDDDGKVLFVGSDESEVFHGRQGAAGFMKGLFELPFTFAFDLKHVTVRQTGDYAWVFVDGNMVRTGDRGAATGKVVQSRYRYSVSMVRKDGRWRWQLFHGSAPAQE